MSNVAPPPSALTEDLPKEEKNQAESQIVQAPTSQDDVAKLKSIVRQLFSEKQTLKKELEKEINSHEQDVARLQEEKAVIRSEYSKIAESISKAPIPAPTDPAKDEQIKQLSSEVSDLTASLRQARLELHDVTLSLQVSQKQVEQYKITVSTLEDDLTHADADKYQITQQKSQISTLEDELRQKGRQLKELEVAVRMKDHEVQKLQTTLEQSGSSASSLAVQSSEVVSISPETSSILSLVQKAYASIESKTDPLNAEMASAWISSLPDSFKSLREENDSLMQISASYKHKFAKLKGPKPNDQDLAMPPPEKMKAALKIYMLSDRKKSEKIKTLKGIVERQQNALQRMIGHPASGEALSVSMRKIIKQLSVCPPNERQKFGELGLRVLDAMLGVQF